MHHAKTAIAALLRPLLLVPVLGSPLTLDRTAAAQAVTTATASDRPAAGDARARATESFRQVVAEYEAWKAIEFPEQARARGIPTREDAITMSGISVEGRRHGQRNVFLDELTAIDPGALDPHDRLDYDLLLRELQLLRERYERGFWLLAVGPLHGPHQSLHRIAEAIDFRTTTDYERYLQRLSWVPETFTQAIEMLQAGLERGLVAPKVTLVAVPSQLKALLDGGLESLRDPFLRFPAAVPAERRAELLAEFDQQTLPRIRAAVEELERMIRLQYLPKCRESVGCSEIPGGAELYRFLLAKETTTSLTPDEIHQIGLSEVARIRAEMLEVIRRTEWFRQRSAAGATTEDAALFAEFLRHLRTDPSFYHRSAEELLSGYRDICKRIDAHLPRLFGRLPRLPYGVRAIPAFMAPSQTTAYYDPGSIANGEPGWFSANTYALDQRPTYEMIPLSLHEAVPGHHLQIALANEIEGLREFRRDIDATAFVEGWALYAERLGIEMGLYENPYDDFGRLLYEMWRSCRLVVDTGLHAQGWSRERAIAFMTEQTALSDLNIANEVDRYIAWPGQACAYKLGELAIRKLRSKAETTLGERFSLRRFHDAVLANGPLPLSILERELERWIAAEAARE